MPTPEQVARAAQVREQSNVVRWRDRMLNEYDQIEDAIERSSQTLLWQLADFLVDNVVPQQGARTDLRPRRRKLSFDDVAERRGRSRRYLQRLRRVGEITRPNRLPDVTPNVYEDVLNQNGFDLDAANAALQRHGTRRRDHRIPESAEATREQVRRMAPSERAAVVAEVLSTDEGRAAVLENTEAADGVSRAAIERTGRMLPPRPQDPVHDVSIGSGWWSARKWIADATFLLWRVQNFLLDHQPTPEVKAEMLDMVGVGRDHLDRIEAMLGGDTELDQDLAAAVARWEEEFNR